MVLNEIINNIKQDFEFVGTSYDKQGNIIGSYHLYSITIQALPTQVDVIRNTYPNFNVTKLSNNWYIVGFNKTN